MQLTFPIVLTILLEKISTILNIFDLYDHCAACCVLDRLWGNSITLYDSMHLLYVIVKELLLELEGRVNFTTIPTLSE